MDVLCVAHLAQVKKSSDILGASIVEWDGRKALQKAERFWWPRSQMVLLIVVVVFVLIVWRPWHWFALLGTFRGSRQALPTENGGIVAQQAREPARVEQFIQDGIGRVHNA
jgi:hypothetical protein